MANVATAKSGPITSAIMYGSKIGTGGTDFFIRVARSKIRNRMKMDRSTADGASQIGTWDLNYMPDIFITLSGFVAAQSVDTSLTLMASMRDSAKNPSPAAWAFQLAPSYFMRVAANCLVIHDMEIGWAIGGSTIAIMLDCAVTDTYPTFNTTSS